MHHYSVSHSLELSFFLQVKFIDYFIMGLFDSWNSKLIAHCCNLGQGGYI